MSDWEKINHLEKEWQTSSRWQQIKRGYSAEDVIKLRPSIEIKYSLAEQGAKKFWQILTQPGYTHALGTLTGAQAVNMVKAGLKAIYMSGWQVAADANLSLQTYPDQSLYPSNSVPQLVKRIQAALMRADQIDRLEGGSDTDWFIPILADAEAGFGGPLHAFELMKMMIEAGVGAVHFEDQLASEKKCGHLGGKVLVPTSQFIRTLIGARLAADVCGVSTCIVARTDALAARLLTSDIDPYDQSFIEVKERTSEGYYRVHAGIESAIARALAYAPYADALWFETSTPDLDEAKEFATAIHAKFPGKPLAYNCSPSFNWEKYLDKKTIARFQNELGDMGYKFQFITLAGWHLLNYYTFDLAHAYQKTGMSAYVELQNREFAREKEGYTAAKHQREVGTGYFDKVLMTVTGGLSSTSALKGSTEEDQFGAESSKLHFCGDGPGGLHSPSPLT